MVHQKNMLVIFPEEVVQIRRIQPQTLRDELEQVLAKLLLLRYILLLCFPVDGKVFASIIDNLRNGDIKQNQNIHEELQRCHNYL